MKECSTCRRCYPDTVNHCPADGGATFHSIQGEPVLDGRYELERRLGQGGMGIVFLARHVFLKTSHAIKVILPDLVGNDPNLPTRFRQEALAAASVQHQNIVNVTDFGVLFGTTPFLVMEYIEGMSLHEIIQREGCLPWPRALELMQPIAAGVSAAHKAGVIHRDLKPLNIVLKTDLPPSEGLRILDFGLAKIKSGELLGSFVQAQTTGLMGSPFYMAPEQWSDEEIDARADIYSIGVILYQMLAGDVPFKGSSIPSVMKKHLTQAPPSFQSMGVSVPLRVENAVMRALAKDPAKRFGSVEDFKQELLEAARDPEGISPSVAATINKNVVEPQFAVEPEPTLPTLEVSVTRLTASESDLLLNSLSPGVETIPRGQEPFTVIQDDLTLHMDKQQIKTPEQSLFSSNVALRHTEAFRHSEEHIFEDLVLHKDYERLWRSLIHAGGGCNLLTGYGPFGGTSLVRCAIAKARAELNKTMQGQAALLVFYFEVLSEDKQSFELKASKFGLEHLNKSGAGPHNAGFEELKARAGEGTSLLNFSLVNPLGQTFFNPHQRAAAPAKDYDFAKLVEDLNTYFREQSSSRALRQIVINLVRSKFLPSCVVFIIDRVKHLETIEALAASDFFSNKRIRVIVVSRKEDLDSWNDAYNRLDAINFSTWYVPCLWSIDFDKVLFDIGAGTSLALKDDWKTFLKHLQFVGRGSLGNILKELRHGRNVNFGERANFIDVEHLAGRTDIQHNAWLQELLEVNWESLLSDHFLGVDQQEKTDRARIGVYYLLDWLSHENPFTKEELIAQSQKTKITISDVSEIRTEIIESLLHVLMKTEYLVQQGSLYKIRWNKERPRRKVTRKLPALPARSQLEKTEDLQSTATLGSAPRMPSASDVDFAGDRTRVPFLKRLTKALMLFVNSGTTHTPQTPSTSVKAVPADVSSKPPDPIHTQTAVPLRLEEVPPRGIVKLVETTIREKYFNDPNKPLEGSIGMLVVFANPKGSNALRLGEEDRIIRECIRRCKYRAAFREKIVHAARIEDFQLALIEDEYQVVQFSGHGTPTGELAFEDETGQLKLVSQNALANLLKEFPSIQCVLLNACYSKDQGHIISLGVPFTIAMDKAISDDASQSFTRGFYDALGAGKDYPFAYRMGCQAISLDGYAEESTPVLLERPQ
jgi:eukaryotic-like serine/threonine-protein kinase